MIAVLLGARRHRAGIRSGLGLGQSERDELLARGDAGEPALFLLVGAADDDGERPQRVHREPHAHATACTRELFHDDAQVEHAATHAAVLLGNPHAREARRLDGFLHLPRVLLRDVVLGCHRSHRGLGQLTRALPEFDLHGGIELFDHPFVSRVTASQRVRAAAAADQYYQVGHIRGYRVLGVPVRGSKVSVPD
jgi:hypothetical protein